jgi:hypothetical protein
MQKLYSKLTPFPFLPLALFASSTTQKKVALGENPFNKKAFSRGSRNGDRIVNVCNSSGGGKSFQQKPCDYANGHEQFETIYFDNSFAGDHKRKGYFRH